jgi:hypothetical protein
MKLGDVFKALFVMPVPQPKAKVRCVTHDEIFDEAMDMSFHETMNLNCEWERLNE